TPTEAAVAGRLDRLAVLVGVEPVADAQAEAGLPQGPVRRIVVGRVIGLYDRLALRCQRQDMPLDGCPRLRREGELPLGFPPEPTPAGSVKVAHARGRVSLLRQSLGRRCASDLSCLLQPRLSRRASRHPMPRTIR